MIEITAPADAFEEAGDGVEGLLEGWLVEENDQVSAGQPVADAIVVKTSFQILAPSDGAITQIVVSTGETFGPGAVLATLEEGAGGPTAAPEPETAERRRIPLTGMRGAVAREMALAWQQPRVAIGAEVEMTATLELLARLRGQGHTVSPTHAVIRAVALELREHPRLNATIAGDAVELVPDADIGLAVSLDEGVIVPVIRSADAKPIPELAAEAARLADQARGGSLPGSALRDGTFTVSTLGATGIDWFTPILNAPQVAILGVGRVAERVIARDGVAVVAPTMALTLVFDHRAIDGHPAALFLAAVRERLERASL